MPLRPRASLQANPLVLLVEDEALVAFDLVLLLEGYGCRVLGPAATATAALRLLWSERPDIALLDVQLLGGMVTPVAERLLILDVPFVLMSARPKHLLPAEILMRAPYLGKPVNEHRLFDILAAMPASG